MKRVSNLFSRDWDQGGLADANAFRYFDGARFMRLSAGASPAVDASPPALERELPSTGPAAAAGPAAPAAIVNEAPTVGGLDGDSVAYLEGGAGVRLDLGGDAGIADPGGTGFQMNLVGVFTMPTFVAPLPDGSGRVFVLEKAGLIRILDPETGVIAATPYLDVSGQIAINNEDGLVGFATAPDYATSGISYVFLVNSAGNIEIREYQAPPGSPEQLDPDQYSVVLTIPTPTDFHNGGWIGFGPDGYLYIGVGDANSTADPPPPQDPDSLLGKILRIDVSSDGFPGDPLRNYAIPAGNPFADGVDGAGEVWAMGLRNPFRGSFDPVTGNLYVGDVGQGAIEEIDLILPGANYGWPFEEGSQPYLGGVPTDGFTLPVIEYEHGRGPFHGNSVIGGYVYRGPIEALQGLYIFGDFIRGNIWAVPVSSLQPGTTVTAEHFISLNGAFLPDQSDINLITSFGVDEDGNLYVCDFDGDVFRLTPTATGNFAGGSLRVAITANLVAGEDRLQIDVSEDTGVTLSNGLAVGSEVRVDGVLIGLVADQGTGTGGNALVIDLGGGATAERVSLLIRAVTYSNSNLSDPSEATRTITFTLIDGGGTAGGGHDQVVATTMVTVTGINDAPAGADIVRVAVQDVPLVLGVGHFAYSDEDGDGLSSVIIATLPEAGLLLFDADGAGGNEAVAVTAGQEISAADIAAGRLIFRAAPGATGDPYTDFTFQVRDDGGIANGGADLDLTPNQLTLVVLTPGARDDLFETDEATAIGAGLSLFLDNGLGPDAAGGGAPLAVTAVQGSAAAVGQQIMLASGARLIVNADGTFVYDPNHAFDWLTAAGSGAVNLTAPDSFSYTIADGSTATVQLLVHGVVSSGDLLLGGPAADTITGTAGADHIDGQDGADTMSGLGGDDVYLVDNLDDVVIEAAGGGHDTVFARTTYVLAGGSAVEVLSTVNLARTEPINLIGNEFANIVYGNAGANLLDGGAGADTLTGLGGDDIYFVDHADDAIVEANGGGYDTAYASASYALSEGSHVEILSAIDWTSSAALGLNGNEISNILFGNAGDNVLNGGGGADSLTGFGGHDVYFLDNAADTVAEANGGGFDTIYTSVSYTLGAGVYAEVLSTSNWAGTGALNLTGNELDNRLYGNAGANVLTGGNGADWLSGMGGGGVDTLIGGAGDDIYWIYAGSDAITESAGNGYDTAYLYTSYVLAAGADVEVVSTFNWLGTQAIDLTGNGLANSIFGNAGANTLNGGTGADYLVGFGGADTFVFTTALGGGNVDTIADFDVVNDRIALDDAIFAGLAEGELNPGAFVIGSAALDSADRIIYNPVTGQLLYDADGSGAGAAVHFATLTPGLALSASDFMVI